MDARAVTWIWILTSFLNVIGPTSSVSITQDDERKSTMMLKRAIPTETFEILALTRPIENRNIYKPTMIESRNRFYRQADTEAITSIESMTDSTTPIQETDLTDRYSSLVTSELPMSTDKTVIPLNSTESSISDLRELKETDESTLVMTTDKPNDPKETELMKNANSVETTDLPKVNEKDDIESSSNLNRTESEMTSVQPLGLSDKHKNVESSDQLEVVGIPKMAKRTEIIMTLQASKEQEYVWLKETIHNMLQVTMLKRETDNYITQLHHRYYNLPVNDADNKIWTKYSTAIVESFVLEFCRNYPHYTVTEQSIARSHKVEEYDSIFNKTLLHLQQRRGYTAIQFAAPVRRAADIYKAILDAPIGIVQSKCITGMPRWMCFAEYVVHLADISETCEHIWYHAQVHLTVLQSIRDGKGAKDPAHEVISELDARLTTMETKNDVNFLFDHIIQTLEDLRQRLKEPLHSQASFYSLIRKLQSEDKLNCLNIEQEW